MLKSIKFPLIMKNGEGVRTLEELEENFDQEKILEYFLNGKLLTWLKDRGYEDKGEIVSNLNSKDEDFFKKLVEALGIKAEIKAIDIEGVEKRGEKLGKVKKLVADEKYLEKIDKIALTQEELVELIKKGVKEIYLIGERFELPLDVENIVFEGVGSVELVIKSEEHIDFKKRGVVFKNIVFDKAYQSLRKEVDDSNMVFVEGGKFTPTFSEVEVEIPDFYMSKYQVTQKLYEEVMGTNPSEFKGENLPVEQINWIEAMEFCNRMSIKYKLEPVYVIEGEELRGIRYRDKQEVSPNEADFSLTEGYRLPLEVEWEWAGNGGIPAIQDKTFGKNRFAGGDDADGVAWYSENSGGTTHPVGEKKENELGLYDISGNVWEWCFDSYESSGNIDSENLYIYSENWYIYSGSSKVRRGGCWYNDEDVIALAYRGGNDLSYRSNGVGFRLSRSK